jgi:uncharacterized phage-like protein YoqJ
MDVERKTACFTGHRPQTITYLWDEASAQSLELKAKLEKAIIYLIDNKGVTHFISGMALGVDMIAAEIVLELKSKYPEIKLECALPCETQASRWSEKYRDRYFNIIEMSDKETLLQTHYTADCMHKRNRYMVDHSDYVIAVWDGSPSGTGKTVMYAKENNKAILQIKP